MLFNILMADMREAFRMGRGKIGEEKGIITIYEKEKVRAKREKTKVMRFRKGGARMRKMRWY